MKVTLPKPLDVVMTKFGGKSYRGTVPAEYGFPPPVPKVKPPSPPTVFFMIVIEPTVGMKDAAVSLPVGRLRIPPMRNPPNCESAWPGIRYPPTAKPATKAMIAVPRN